MVLGCVQSCAIVRPQWHSEGKDGEPGEGGEKTQISFGSGLGNL